MTHRGPIITLVAVIVLGLALFVVNLVRVPGAPPPAETSPPVAAPQATPTTVEPATDATPFPFQAKYTGKTEGKTTGEAAIAIAVKGDNASAYVCDGKALEAWYNGSAQDGKLELKGKGDNTLTGTLNDDTITGVVSAHGKSWTFTTELAQQPAGLYRSSAGGTTTGWIRQQDGSVTGIRKDRNGALQPAPQLDTATAQPVEGDTLVVR